MCTIFRSSIKNSALFDVILEVRWRLIEFSSSFTIVCRSFSSSYTKNCRIYVSLRRSTKHKPISNIHITNSSASVCNITTYRMIELENAVTKTNAKVLLIMFVGKKSESLFDLASEEWKSAQSKQPDVFIVSFLYVSTFVFYTSIVIVNGFFVLYNALQRLLMLHQYFAASDRFNLNNLHWYTNRLSFSSNQKMTVSSSWCLRTHT